MAEITSSGYISIREHIVGNWKKVVLLTSDNIQVFSTNIGGTKASWTHTKSTEEKVVGYNDFGEPITEQVAVESNPNMEITVTVTGADVMGTVSKVRVLDTQNRIMTEETFSPFTFENSADELTLKVKIQVPQQ
ncbi:hypothetical protein GGR02_003017 [Anoxybacillus voinovskiensis]|uniref:Uncharacterized protein n=1 Tax=Anoxybacteroides voinovskiense TaxID=230470 RepID=A0A840DQB3_9BACL|nr:hypothetical protein [Anoxybacillus voinovskiensis]MBB4075200.1 hypothetical protein [Anoxybacillus voinovskiensis]GGJ77088.1 hypothetical protein GCM10008982_28050 [Anoxybacillus voinovskiensis]